MGTLDGRRALVTGASSGIGEETARALRRAGAEVALLARSADRLDELARELGAVAVPADVADGEAVETAVADAADRLGGIDLLANIAGVARPGSPSAGDPADWRLMLDVNVLGLLQVTRAVVPHLREAGRGDIVNLSSMSGRRLASVSGTVYSATKFAVHTISEGLRRELAGDGIRVTTIAPGYVDTAIFDDVDDPDQRVELREIVREQGLDPATVADQIVHVASQPPDVNLLEVAMMSLRQQS